jgi:hypothetical protein
MGHTHHTDIGGVSAELINRVSNVTKLGTSSPSLQNLDPILRYFKSI